MLTVNTVAVALVTVPTALLLKAIVLLPAVVLKPKPLIVMVVALAARAMVRLVTTGITVATFTDEPLLILFVVTWAVRLPAAVGLVEKLTFSEVAVADVTVPTAPLLKVTVLPEAVGLKPKPLIVTLEALAARLAELLVITGMTVATWTAAPALVTVLAVTNTGNDPAVVGDVVKVTVSEVGVAAVTLPAAKPLKSTLLLARVELKPKPLMVRVAALAARLVVLLVITGTTVAT